MMLDAIIRNLEVIGEAVKHVSASIKLSYPDVEWKKIAGLRDVLVHEYFGINHRILWDITDTKIRELKEKITFIIQKEQ